MKNDIRASNIIDKIKGKTQKRPFNITINTTVIDEFAVVCSLEKVSKSEVIEQLIKSFLDTYKQDRPEYVEFREKILDAFQKTGKIPGKLVGDMVKRVKKI